MAIVDIDCPPPPANDISSPSEQLIHGYEIFRLQRSVVMRVENKRQTEERSMPSDIPPAFEKGINVEPSSTICRKQEAVHRAKASETSLENVRLIATRAANAWASEAVVAERREARKANAAAEIAAPEAEAIVADPERARTSWSSLRRPT